MIDSVTAFRLTMMQYVIDELVQRVKALSPAEDWKMVDDVLKQLKHMSREQFSQAAERDMQNANP